MTTSRGYLKYLMRMKRNGHDATCAVEVFVAHPRVRVEGEFRDAARDAGFARFEAKLEDGTPFWGL